MPQLRFETSDPLAVVAEHRRLEAMDVGSKRADVVAQAEEILVQPVQHETERA
jgi:hypothetical protein